MTDPYRISPAHEPAPPAERSGDRGMLRPALWLVLVFTAAANGVSSTVGLHPLVGIGFGLVTLACAAALIVHHRRRRR